RRRRPPKRPAAAPKHRSARANRPSPRSPPGSRPRRPKAAPRARRGAKKKAPKKHPRRADPPRRANPEKAKQRPLRAKKGREDKPLAQLELDRTGEAILRQRSRVGRSATIVARLAAFVDRARFPA